MTGTILNQISLESLIQAVASEDLSSLGDAIHQVPSIFFQEVSHDGFQNINLFHYAMILFKPNAIGYILHHHPQWKKLLLSRFHYQGWPAVPGAMQIHTALSFFQYSIDQGMLIEQDQPLVPFVTRFLIQKTSIVFGLPADKASIGNFLLTNLRPPEDPERIREIRYFFLSPSDLPELASHFGFHLDGIVQSPLESMFKYVEEAVAQLATWVELPIYKVTDVSDANVLFFSDAIYFNSIQIEFCIQQLVQAPNYPLSLIHLNPHFDFDDQESAVFQVLQSLLKTLGVSNIFPLTEDMVAKYCEAEFFMCPPRFIFAQFPEITGDVLATLKTGAFPLTPFGNAFVTKRVTEKQREFGHWVQGKVASLFPPHQPENVQMLNEPHFSAAHYVMIAVGALSIGCLVYYCWQFNQHSTAARNFSQPQVPDAAGSVRRRKAG